MRYIVRAKWCLHCKEEFTPHDGSDIDFCSWECEERQSAAEDAYHDAYHGAATVH